MTQTRPPRRPVTAAELRLAGRCPHGRVLVIDDDPEILDAVRALLELDDYACETYGSALAFLATLAGTVRVSRAPAASCATS